MKKINHVDIISCLDSIQKQMPSSNEGICAQPSDVSLFAKFFIDISEALRNENYIEASELLSWAEEWITWRRMSFWYKNINAHYLSRPWSVLRKTYSNVSLINAIKLNKLSFLVGYSARSPKEDALMYELFQELKADGIEPGWIPVELSPFEEPTLCKLVSIS